MLSFVNFKIFVKHWSRFASKIYFIKGLSYTWINRLLTNYLSIPITYFKYHTDLNCVCVREREKREMKSGREYNHSLTHFISVCDISDSNTRKVTEGVCACVCERHRLCVCVCERKRERETKWQKGLLVLALCMPLSFRILADGIAHLYSALLSQAFSLKRFL